MKVLAIDPGNKQSAYVIYEDGVILESDICENHRLLRSVSLPSIVFEANPDHMAIEMIACYGMGVGKTVFDTCVWIGRFIEAWNPKPATKVYRMDCKMHLCHSTRAKDSNIRQAIIDRYPAVGGGKIPQIGTKKSQGPLYGVSKDIWAALAVAITFTETFERSTHDDEEKVQRQTD